MVKLRNKQETTRPEIVIGTTEGLPLARVPGAVREQVRYLWTRIQVHGGELPRSIAVTSKNSGEGVSFTSQALATVLARVGSTCLIEANWWGNRLPFEENTPGLASLLTAQAPLSDLLVQTNHPGLSILPAGELVEVGQAVMASSEAMEAVLQHLRASFEYVVLDLPSIASSPLALSFAPAAEATLLVVRQRSTRVEDVKSAMNDLRHTQLLGVVINGHRLSIPSFLQSRLLDN